MDTRQRELLLRSLDTALNSREQAKLEAALAASPALCEERDSLLRLRAAAGGIWGEGFGPYFADRVMATIDAEAVWEHSLAAELMAVFRPVALAALVVLAVLAPFGGRVLYESMNTQQSLVSVADGAYALDLEDVLCQTD